MQKAQYVGHKVRHIIYIYIYIYVACLGRVLRRHAQYMSRVAGIAIRMLAGAHAHWLRRACA